MSVRPGETGFGRKTRIHRAWCNSDLSCLKGDCPSFLLVEPGTPALRIIRHYHDSAGAAFEISVTIHPAGRFKFSMLLQRERT